MFDSFSTLQNQKVANPINWVLWLTVLGVIIAIKDIHGKEIKEPFLFRTTPQDKGLAQGKIVDDSFMVAILRQLAKVYPGNIECDKDILPEYENRKEIMKYLVHCKNEGWIDFKEIREDQVVDMPVECQYIKITNPGLNKLSELSK